VTKPLGFAFSENIYFAFIFRVFSARHSDVYACNFSTLEMEAGSRL
jgi:hypothetical protein